MGSVGSLRSALFLQAALTAGWGLLRSDGGAWTILTMVVAAAAVFVGAALQPTSDWRTALQAFEGLAVLYGLLGLPAHHVVPATLLAAWVLALTLTQSAALAFAGAPVPTLTGLGVPVAPEPTAPAPEPEAPAIIAEPAPADPPELVVPAQPVVQEAPPVPPVAVVPRAAPSMTILPQR